MAKERLFRLIMTVILLGGGFLAAFGPGGVSPVSACSCIMPGPPDEAFNQAAAVFSGKVTSISGGRGFLSGIMSFFGLNSFSGFDRDITIEVIDSWKGVDTTEVVIQTGLGGGDCGYPFDEGSDYLIYGYAEGSGYWAHICSRTAAISSTSAADDFTYLASKPTLTLKSAGSSDRVAGLIIVVGGILVVGLGIIFLFRRRGKPELPA